MITLSNLEDFFGIFFEEWKLNFSKKNYLACDLSSIQILESLKVIYNNRTFGEGIKEDEAYALIYLYLILTKGLIDVLDLVNLTGDNTWPSNNQLTETIWSKLWDAKERLDIFLRHSVDRNILNFLLHLLNNLEYNFYDIFGKGLYMSPVTIIKKSECSICSKNIKGCHHIPGRFYKGKICKTIYSEIEDITSVDIVSSPYDMRCRIWPWNFISENKFNVRILSFNQLDDFIFKN